MKHPEQHSGELFLTNIQAGDFPEIGWQTKRCGEIAYDIYGKSAVGLKPVFIQRAEVEARLAEAGESSIGRHVFRQMLDEQ